MKILLSVCLTASTLLVTAQQRVNDPLPILSKEPAAILESAIGWCQSLDGQWISQDNTIPIRTNSRDKGRYESKTGQLGMDNFESFRLYPVSYADSTLLLLVKVYTDGHYKYASTKKGWKTNTKAHYYLITRHSWNRVIQLHSEGIHLVRIPLLDAGVLDVTGDNDIKKEFEKVSHVRRLDRSLIVQYQQQFQNMRFQIYSVHDVFDDIEGVRQDFRLHNNSFYGKEELFRYLYYEITLQEWLSFVSMQQG